MTSATETKIGQAKTQAEYRAQNRTPGFKFMVMLIAGFILSLPILSVYALNWDRQNRSAEARESISQGWGGSQNMAGPILAVPHAGGWAEIKASQLDITTKIDPERRKRSIYEVVVYQATNTGKANFTLPDTLAEDGYDLKKMDFANAELRFSLSDQSGLAGAAPDVKINGQPLKLRAGRGGTAFYARVDARALTTGALVADFNYLFRGNGELALKPSASETNWTVTSPWPSPSFGGDFLPVSRKVGDNGFEAKWKIGNLAFGNASSNAMQAAAATADAAASEAGAETASEAARPASYTGPEMVARVDLVEPVDVYGQVDRATKYGFLFIGFTFVAFLMFDIIGGHRVTMMEYILVGAALVLFFIMLLAMAEVMGFASGYILASAAIIGLITAYSAAVLKSWGRAKWIGGMLVGLYATLYTLLSLEDVALLIGSLLLFVALAGIMYLTRNIDWGAKQDAELPRDTEPLTPAKLV
jgi:inner membrane protein